MTSLARGLYLKRKPCARSNDSAFRKSTTRPFDEWARLGPRHGRRKAFTPIAVAEPPSSAHAIGRDDVGLGVGAVVEPHPAALEEKRHLQVPVDDGPGVEI